MNTFTRYSLLFSIGAAGSLFLFSTPVLASPTEAISERTGNHVQKIVRVNRNSNRLSKNSLPTGTQSNNPNARMGPSNAKKRTRSCEGILDLRGFDVDHNGKINREEGAQMEKYVVRLAHSRAQAWNALRQPRAGAPEPIDDANLIPSKDAPKPTQ